MYVLAEIPELIETVNLDRDGVNGKVILAIAIAIYLVVLFVFSLIASRNIENEEDFLVAGRRLGLFLSLGSLVATWFGADTVTGVAEAARAEGMRGVILDPWASAVTLILAGIFLAKPLWKMKLLTTSDFFRRAYGPRTELTCAVLQIPCYFGWIATQYIALGEVQKAYFGIDLTLGIVLGFLIALVYTMVGGMWSVSLIDTIQIVIAFLGILIIGFFSFATLGDGSFSHGVATLLEKTPADTFSLRPAGDANILILMAWTGTWATGLFGNFPAQDLQQRIFSANSAKTARNCCILAGIVYLAFGMIPVLLGLISRLELPVEESVVKVKILMYMAGHNLNIWLAVIFLTSFVSIVMSTACSAVLAPATILGHNIVGRLAKFERHHLLIERLSVAVISLFGLILAFSGESILDLLDLSLSLSLSALFIPFIMGLFGRPRGELSGILAAVLGFSFFLARYLPEKVFLPLPPQLHARSTQSDHFRDLARAVDEKTYNSQVRKDLLRQAEKRGRKDMSDELAKLVAVEAAHQLVEATFESGFDWNGYLKLRFSTENSGLALHRLLFNIVTVPRFLTLGYASRPEDRQIGLASIPADYFGILASLAGYFLGQWILALQGRPRPAKSIARAVEESDKPHQVCNEFAANQIATE